MINKIFKIITEIKIIRQKLITNDRHKNNSISMCSWA